ncbi:phage distal tail protein [Streptomyces sp. NPDC048241]|uniref:phage distal tail protein n=1 Tax=Streptomyces sp. NPDC048241 TaxID=3365521 RepID=UPI0037220925
MAVPSTDIDGLQATLGSLRLGAVDSTGAAWRLQTLEGWDSPDVRAEYQEREADHGAWASPVYLGSRPITLGGIIEAPDRSTLQAAMDQLSAAVTLTDTTLTVWEQTPRQCTVRRSGKLLTQYVTDRVATWSALVTAADPRRYEITQQTGTTGLPATTGGLTFPVTFPITFSATTVSGQIIATNAGNIGTRPVITITGPVSTPVVSALYPDGTVRQLLYSLDLAAGDTLVIDVDAHSVLLAGGVSRRRFLTVSGGWPAVPPGASVAFQFQAATYTPTAALTVAWRSAWM